jgi:hypothetical protein
MVRTPVAGGRAFTMSRMVRRSLNLAILGYVLAGLVSLGLERIGYYSCGCLPDCWCKRPALRVFRWVFPYGHHLALSAEAKRSLES